MSADSRIIQIEDLPPLFAFNLTSAEGPGHTIICGPVGPAKTILLEDLLTKLNEGEGDGR